LLILAAGISCEMLADSAEELLLVN